MSANSSPAPVFLVAAPGTGSEPLMNSLRIAVGSSGTAALVTVAGGEGPGQSVARLADAFADAHFVFLAAARQARLNVGVQVMHFASAGRKLSAKGLVTATLTDSRGRTSTVHTAVALTASTGGGCKVLHLFLNELTLQLLGLNAHLDKVTLDITGQAKGGILGSLFCKLSKAKVASARTTALRTLNAQVRRNQGHVLHFNNPTTTTTATTT
jgi:hypothetical protein